MRAKLPELALALLVRAFLGRVQKLARASRRREARRDRNGAASPSRAAVPPQRGPLMLLTLGCFALGLPVMILFELPLTRVLGVALMLGFIVCGVFLVANPTFLGREEE